MTAEQPGTKSLSEPLLYILYDSGFFLLSLTKLPTES